MFKFEQGPGHPLRRGDVPFGSSSSPIRAPQYLILPQNPNSAYMRSVRGWRSWVVRDGVIFVELWFISLVSFFVETMMMMLLMIAVLEMFLESEIGEQSIYNGNNVWLQKIMIFLFFFFVSVLFFSFLIILFLCSFEFFFGN